MLTRAYRRARCRWRTFWTGDASAHLGMPLPWVTDLKGTAIKGVPIYRVLVWRCSYCKGLYSTPDRSAVIVGGGGDERTAVPAP